MKVYIHNPTLSQFGKLNETVQSISVKTARKCLHGFETSEIQFLVLSTFAPEVYTKEYHLAVKVASELNLKNIFAIRSDTASSSGASAVQLATNLILSGRFHTGLVIGSEIMSRLNREESNLVLGSVLSDRQRNFCMFMSHGGAMITNRYLYEYGYTKEDLFPIAKKLHDNGLQNPIAHIKKNLTLEEYNKAPLITSPFNIYDISPLSDGSSGIALSSKQKSKFSIRGMGHGTNSFATDELGTSFTASVSAFSRAFSEAQLKPTDVQIAELHDAFTMFEVIGAEDAGLFPRGKGLAYIKAGKTHPDGQLPINASGGLKTRGHPIGASGIAQIAEICNLMESKGKEIGLCHSIGGLATNNFATIIEKES